MMHGKVSAETRSRTINDADIGVAGWLLKAISWASAFRKGKKGISNKIAAEIVYRSGQIGFGALLVFSFSLVFGMPLNAVSGLVIAGALSALPSAPCVSLCFPWCSGELSERPRVFLPGSGR